MVFVSSVDLCFFIAPWRKEMHRVGQTVRRLAKYGIVLGGGTCILAWATMPGSSVGL